MSELCKRKGVEIIAAECMLDYVHMFGVYSADYVKNRGDYGVDYVKSVIFAHITNESEYG